MKSKKILRRIAASIVTAVTLVTAVAAMSVSANEEIMYTDTLNQYDVESTYDGTGCTIPVTLRGSVTPEGYPLSSIYITVYDSKWNYLGTAWSSWDENEAVYYVNEGYNIYIASIFSNFKNNELIANGKRVEMSESSSHFDYTYTVKDTDTALSFEYVYSPWSEERLNSYTYINNTTNGNIFDKLEEEVRCAVSVAGYSPYIRDNSLFAIAIPPEEYNENYVLKVNDTVYDLVGYTETNLYESIECWPAYSSYYFTDAIVVPENVSELKITYESPTGEGDPDCTHPTVSDNGVCTDCKKAFAAKIVLGNVERTETLYDDFSEAVSELGKLYNNAELVVYSDYKGDIAADLPQPVELKLNQCTITGDITLTGSGHFMVCGNGEIDGNIVHSGTGDVDISNGVKAGDIVSNSAVSISDSSVGNVTAKSFGAYNGTIEINGTITVNGGKAWFYCQPVFNGETDFVLNNGSTIVLAEDFDKDCVVVVDAPAGVVVVFDTSYGADLNADNFVSADGYMVVKNDDNFIEFISLVITSQPTNYTGAIGSTAKFTVDATGATSYQWQQNTGAGWTNINTTMGRSKTFSLGVTAARAKYQYRCVVSDGTTSLITDAVKMIVKETLAITTQPTNFNGAIGDTAKFTVNATGATSYQWQQNTGAGWTNINTTVGRSKTFSLGVTAARTKYQYRCVVSDGTTSLITNAVKMVVDEELAITTQPVNFTGEIGDTAKFTVVATGTTSYQWYQNTGAGWTAINTTAGRSKTFSIAVAQFRLNYKYRCVVSDGTNTITSNEVKMVINEDLAITTQPSNYIGAIGSTAKFTVGATGATSYQWYQNTGNGWTAINTTAGRSNTFSVAVAEFRLGYLYRCVVSDGTNSLTSDEVQMYIG